MTSLLIFLMILTQHQSLTPLSPKLGVSTIIDEQKVNQFKQEHSDWFEEVLEEELLMNFFYPSECDCWGDGFYNCIINFDAESSSNLSGISNLAYGATNLTDFDLRTAWVEGTEGLGIGERITIDVSTVIDENLNISELVIVNGYVKNRNIWEANSRIRKFKLFIDEEPKAILNLQDTDKYQKFDISKFVSGKHKLTIMLEILDVIKGTKYSDTAISEIFVKGTGCM